MKRTFGINDGFYPLGSCTMKYNPKINEDIAKLSGFIDIHPLQPIESIQGCLEVMKKAEEYLCEITGMDAMDFQPAAGAHGEFTGLKLIWAYHQERQDTKRTKIIVPDSAHGTNPASAAMAGFSVINVPSTKEGFVDTEALRKVVGEDKVKLIYTLGGKKKDVLLKVVLPGNVPSIISQMKVNIGLSLVGVIIGEFLAAKAGLGYLIIYGSQVFKLDWVIMSIVILCIVATGLYKILALFEKKFSR